MAAEAEATSHVERRYAQAARDRCAATARLLRRAGMDEQAEQVMAAAPTPQPAVAAHEGVVVSLRPPTIASCAHERSSACLTTPITWNGSVVAASSLMPPARGHTLTPVQVAVEGVVFLPPGERRARVAIMHRRCGCHTLVGVKLRFRRNVISKDIIK
jgi:hypothetical protein